MLLISILVGSAGCMLMDAHEAARRAAEQSGGNLVLSLEHDIARNIEIYDLALQSTVRGMGLSGLASLSPEVRQATLFDNASHAADFGAILVTDASGTIIHDSISPQPREGNLATRQWFSALRNDSGDDLHISVTKGTSLTGRSGLILSRRIDGPGGAFAGAVAGFLDVDYFRALFSHLALGPADTLIVMTAEGRIVDARPFKDGDIGRDVPNAEVIRDLRVKPSGAFEGQSALDGVQRIFAYHQIGDWPLVVQVGLASDAVFAEWREKALVTGGILVGLIGFSALLASALRRELRRRGQAEIAASLSEAKYRLLAEHGDHVVIKVDRSGIWQYVSPVATRLLGRSPESLLGRDPREMIHPGDQAEFHEFKRKLIGGKAETGALCFRILHPERGVIWIEKNMRVLRGAETGWDGYIATLRDVTQRQAAEAALRASEARYRLLADNTSDVITCFDLNLQRTYASPACRTLFGLEPEEMLGGTPSTLLEGEERERVTRAMLPVVRGEVDQTVVTFRARHRAGHQVWVEAVIGLVRNSDTQRPESLVCTLRDISERQAKADELRSANAALGQLTHRLTEARDQAEQASRAKSRFLAGMSHELRTPLHGILGYAQLLRVGGGLGPVQTSRVDAMLGAGQHLLEMINRVLALSEVEAEQVELRTIEVEPHTIADTCLDLVRPTAEAKGLQLTCRVAPGTPCQLTTDPTRLRQILVNLLGNAVKFTSKGMVELRLGMSMESASLRLEVADSGPGIPAGKRAGLFREFERLGADAAGAIEGAGLGLALSARLAALLGGRLGHENNEGGGSVFWLELPIRAAAPSGEVLNPVCDVPQPQVQPVAARSLRILLADDVAMNRDVAGSLLRTAGHEVILAEGGREAIDLASTQDFDVVLMDIRMPGMDGLEATRRIRALAGLRGRVPIVALTAQAFSEQIAECRAAGMDSHLAKPFNAAALLKAVVQAGTPQANPSHANPPHANPPHANPSYTGSARQTLNRDAFRRTAAFLRPATLASYLQTIAERAEALRDTLRSPDALADVTDLVAPAHTLAGSAGMFGFELLTEAARKFEHAAQSRSSDLPVLADDLAMAIDRLLPEIDRCSSLVPAEAI